MSKNIIRKFKVITNRSGCLECPHSRCGTYVYNAHDLNSKISRMSNYHFFCLEAKSV